MKGPYMSGNAKRMSAARQRLLDDVLDTLIPSGSGLPSATDVAFDFILSEARTSPEVAAHVEAVLSHLTDFTTLDSAQRGAALEQAPESVLRDPELSYYVLEDGSEWGDVQDWLSEELAGRIAMEREPAEGAVEKPLSTAKDILGSPIYVDRDEREGRNWVEASTDRMGRRF